jgi:hypothetical protein
MTQKDKCKELIEPMVNMKYFVGLYFLTLQPLVLILHEKRKDISFTHKKELAVCAVMKLMVVG